MVVSFVVALVFKTVDLGLASWQQLIIGVGITTIAWVSATFLTKPTEGDHVLKFVAIEKDRGV